MNNINFENFENENEGVELAEASLRFKNCKHEFETEIKETYTADARKIKKKITTCKHNCGYYKVEILEEQPVNDDAIWR